MNTSAWNHTVIVVQSNNVLLVGPQETLVDYHKVKQDVKEGAEKAKQRAKEDTAKVKAAAKDTAAAATKKAQETGR